MSARGFGPWLGPLAFFAVLGLETGLTPVQERTAAVTVWTAIWWISEAVPVGVASLIPAILFPLLAVLPAREAAAPYMDDLVLLFLGAFLLALGLERWGVHKRMALFIVDKLGTRPSRLVFGFTLASAACSMWMNNTATALMLLPSGAAVVAATASHALGNQAERARHAAFGTALMLGIAYGASIGGVATPVGTAPNQVYLGQFRQLFPSGPTSSFSTWMAAFVPLSLLWALACAWLLTRVSPGAGGSALAGSEVVAATRRSLGPWTKPQRSMAAIFLLAVLLWITRSDLVLFEQHLPGWGNALARTLGALPEQAFASDATVALALAALAFLVPVRLPDGSKCMLLEWEVTSKIPWDVLLLIGGGFCLSRAFQSSGLDRALGQAMAPWIAPAPTWAVVLGVILLLIALSEIASNTAICAVMMPVLAQLAVAADMDPRWLMLPAAVAASAGFMLPVATPPNAIVYASRLVPMRSMVRAGLALDLASAVLIFLAFQWWIGPLLGLESSLPSWAKAGP